MALDKLSSLEGRIKDMVEMIQALKRENAALKNEIRAAKDRALKQHGQSDRWTAERAEIKARVEKVLDELDAFEFVEEAREGVPS